MGLGAPLVSLQKDVQVAALAEYVIDTGHQLDAILNQRIDRRALVRILGGVERVLLHVDALASQHHRTQGHLGQFLVQVGDDEFPHEGSYAAGFVVARQHLDGVRSGQKHQVGIPLQRLPGKLRGRFAGEFLVHMIPNIADRGTVLVFHFAYEIDGGPFRSALAGQRQLAARDLDGDAGEVFGRIQLEVIHLQSKVGDLSHGVAHHKRILQLPVLVRGSEFLPRLAGIVGLAIVQFGGGVFFQRNLDPPHPTIQLGISSVIADQVIVGNGRLGLLQAHRKIVVIQQRFSAGIGGQGIQSVLRGLKTGGGSQRARAAVHVAAALRAPGGVAHGRQGHQPARVDGEERGVGPNGGVGGGLELRLVIDAVELQPAGEVNQHLLFIQGA